MLWCQRWGPEAHFELIWLELLSWPTVYQIPVSDVSQGRGGQLIFPKGPTEKLELLWSATPQQNWAELTSA